MSFPLPLSLLEHELIFSGAGPPHRVELGGNLHTHFRQKIFHLWIFSRDLHFFVNFFFITLIVLAVFSVLFKIFVDNRDGFVPHVDAFRMEVYFTEAFLAGSHDSVMFKRLL